jgi:hypothetical protein
MLIKQDKTSKVVINSRDSDLEVVTEAKELGADVLSLRRIK